MNAQHTRFSDVELKSLRTEFNSHVEAHEHLIHRFDRHEENERELHRSLLESQQRNTDAMTGLTIQISQLTEDTQFYVDIKNEIVSAAKLGTRFTKIMKWIAQWGIIGAASAGAITWAVEHFRH